MRVALLNCPPLLGYVTSVAALTLVIRIAGFADKIILTTFFSLADIEVFLVALSIPLMAHSILGALFGPVLLPKFVSRLSGNSDDRAAAQMFHAWFLLAALLLTGGAFVAYACAEWLAVVFAPGFDAERRGVCASMIRAMAPWTVLMGLLPLLGVALNSQRKFIVQPLGELAMKAGSIAVVLALGRAWGITAVLWGACAGIGCYFLVEFAVLGGVWSGRPTLAGFRHADFRGTLLLMAAPCLGTVFARIGEIVERAAASTLEPGSIAALALARKLVDLPLLIIPVASATVLFTYFSELNHANARERVARLLDTAIRAMLVMFVPIAVLTCVLAQPIVAIVYQRGQFDAGAAGLVSQALFWLAPSMCFLAVEMLIMRHFFSRLDVWTPTAIGIGCVGFRVAAIYLLIGPARLGGVCAAIALSRAAKVALLMVVMRKWGGHIQLGDLVRQWSPVGVAATGAGILAWAVLDVLQTPAAASTFIHFRALALAASAGGVAYAGGVLLLCRGDWRSIVVPGRADEGTCP